MELRYEFMVDFTLDLFLSYDKAGQTIVSPLFHALHRIEFISA